MARHDLSSMIDDRLALAPQTITANVTTAPILDTFGSHGRVFSIYVGAATTVDGSNFITMVLKEGNASDLSDAAVVAADDLVVDGTPAAAIPLINATGLANARLCRVGYRGGKRYLKWFPTVTGTVSAFVHAFEVRGYLESAPV